jgi:hypothetical protein
MNLPGWDWKTKQLKQGTSHPNLHQRFKDTVDPHHLIQIVEENTRKDNTLDLILTNAPSIIQSVDILPGISDHDIVFAEFGLHITKLKQQERSIPVCKQANWDQLRHDVSRLLEPLTELFQDNTATVNDMWIILKWRPKRPSQTTFHIKTPNEPTNIHGLMVN